MNHIKDRLALAPAAPGVYLMRDAGGRVIYVGKAKNLRKRLASYFQRPDQGPIKTQHLVKQIANFETIVTATEKEALLLESNLIKRHRPRYNVILKDDKRYPVLRLDTTHPYPNLTIVRKIQKDGAMYFGPFHSAHAVRETLKFVNRTFKLRKCTNHEFATRTRPCLHHQMNACYGPCNQTVDPALYQRMVREVVMFLKGQTPDLIRRIKQEIAEAVAALAFEKAAHMRDKMVALEKTLEKQTAVARDLKDRDVVCLAGDETATAIALLRVRRGYLQGCRIFAFGETGAQPGELISAFIRQYYRHHLNGPREIIVQHLPEDTALLEEWLAQELEHNVRILLPKRGEKKRLLEMGVQNARQAFIERSRQQTDRIALLTQLERRLNLKRLPQRIECFDNSTLGGHNSVSGMVVFEAGQPKPTDYRKFRIPSLGEPDDYAAMAHAIERRFRNHPDWPLPDLLLLDGGKGQLGVVYQVLRDLGLAAAFDLAAIAKRDERKGEPQDKVYRPNRVNPVRMVPEDALLLFLQRIRDEAHRFALQYHRQRRGKAVSLSLLDEVPGIGPERKRQLLRTFGSVKKIRAATAEELSALPGISRQLALRLLAQLQNTAVDSNAE
jgi:excinuclease ABC subunit C